MCIVGTYSSKSDTKNRSVPLLKHESWDDHPFKVWMVGQSVVVKARTATDIAAVLPVFRRDTHHSRHRRRHIDFSVPELVQLISLGL